LASCVRQRWGAGRDVKRLRKSSLSLGSHSVEVPATASSGFRQMHVCSPVMSDATCRTYVARKPARFQKRKSSAVMPYETPM